MRKVFRRAGVLASMLAALLLMGGGYAFAVENPVDGIIPDVSFLTEGPLAGSWRRTFAVILGGLSGLAAVKVAFAIYHLQSDTKRGMAGGAAHASGDVGMEVAKLVAIPLVPAIVGFGLWMSAGS